jgi:hypothetical protein
MDLEMAGGAVARQSTNASPQQLADQILFTCSPRGKTISGQAISICGDTQMLG